MHLLTYILVGFRFWKKQHYGIFIALVLSSFLFSGNALGKNLEGKFKRHGPEIHGGAPFKTILEYHDDGKGEKTKNVFGSVISIRRDPTKEIVEFTVSIRVKNDTKVRWEWYVITYEFAQHPPIDNPTPPPPTLPHWLSEGFDTVDFGPQPVITPVSGTIFTDHFNPMGGATRPDIPARRRGGLKVGGTDTFTEKFTIDQGGAFPVFEDLEFYLTRANALSPRPDIFWARSRSKDVSGYPQPLDSNESLFTKFDGKIPGGQPPPSKSNVSVWVAVSERTARTALALTETRFDPETGTLTVAPTTISAIELVDDPSNSLYAGDFLQGADLIVEGLTLDESLVDTHFFTDGQLRIKKEGITYLEGNLNVFVSNDFPVENQLLRTHAILEDLIFPQGTAVSPWLTDVAADLAENHTRTLNFSFEPSSGESFAAIVSDALSTSELAVTNVKSEVVVGEAVEDFSGIPSLTKWGVAIMLFLLVGGALVMIFRSSTAKALKTGR